MSLRKVVRSKAGAVVASIVVAGSAGVGIWQASVGGFGFRSAAVIATSSCTASCSGTVTLSATAPPQATSVAFKVDGATVGTDSSAPFSFAWDSSSVSDGAHSVIATASGTGGSASSSSVSVSTSNGVQALGNVWVSPTGSDLTGARSATPIALGSAQAFSTIGGAWSAASAGDTIQVADGSYTTGCALSGTKASDTTFVGSANAKIICGVSIPAGNVHVVFDGLTLYTISTSQAGSFVTVKNGALTCQDAAPYQLFTPDSKCNARLSITGTAGASNWTFQNETIGPTYESANCGNSTNDNLINVPVSNFTFDQVTFHDERLADCVARGFPAQHAENFYFEAPFGGAPTTNVTFNRCEFYNGPLSGTISATTGLPDGTGASSTELMLTGGSSGGPGEFSGLTISNCKFYGRGNLGVEGNVDVNFTNGSIIEYSTFPEGGLGVFECTGDIVAHTGNCPNGYTDLTLKGNLDRQQGVCPGDTASDPSSIKYVYNVWYKPQFNGGSPKKCGTNDSTLTNPNSSTDIRALIFTDEANNDFTLLGATGGTAPIGKVPTTQGCVSTDFAGVSRPSANHATACNAGAYENR